MANYTIMRENTQTGKDIAGSLFGPKKTPDAGVLCGKSSIKKNISSLLQADGEGTASPGSYPKKSTSTPPKDQPKKPQEIHPTAMEVLAPPDPGSVAVPGLAAHERKSYVAWHVPGSPVSDRRRRCLIVKKTVDEQRQAADDRRQARYWLQDDLRKLLPGECCSWCQTKLIPVSAQEYAAGQRPGVEVYRHPESDSASYAGLQVCANVWACPLCSPKICYRRRQELEKAVNVWRGRLVAGSLGESADPVEYGTVLLLTFTVEHTGRKSLKDVLAGLQKTYSKMKGTRRYTSIREQQGFDHSVRALELTYGKATGWHPHVHELVFMRGAVQGRSKKDREAWVSRRAIQVADLVWEQYAKAARRQGVVVSRKGFDCRYTEGDIGDYIAKFDKRPVHENTWGVSSELAKGHRKIGYKDKEMPAKQRYTAWELLYKYANEDDGHAGNKFVEFYEAMHGKRQLVWSRGARKFFLGSEDVQDEEIAQQIVQGSELIYIIAPEDWDLVLKYNGRGELLNEAVRGGGDGVLAYLGELRRIEAVGFKEWLEQGVG